MGYDGSTLFLRNLEQSRIEGQIIPAGVTVTGFWDHPAGAGFVSGRLEPQISLVVCSIP